MNFLTKSNEDYLEAILILEEKYDRVLSVNIAKFLNVSKPGVNRAMNILKENGLIEKTDYSEITLTTKGRELANQVYDKHKTIKSFLIQLGVSEETAENDCCLIEHVISNETYEKMKLFLKKETAN
ncbi:MAG: metal-dependent transcriptional regulator [Bacilli bacterium]|nr:metal-dependent transcriptional regulator [Bacilli bacterium]